MPGLDKMQSCVLMGFYGRGNFGDDLMCVALARYLERTSNANGVVLSGEMSTFDEIRPAWQTESRSYKGLLKARSGQIICQGGGSIFHDSYKGSHRRKYWVNLLMWAGFFRYQRIRGARIVVMNGGIGPIEHPITKALCRLAFSACSMVTVRDSASLTTLKNVSPNTPTVLGFDLAALINVPEARTYNDGSPVLGISACTLTPFSEDPDLNTKYWIEFGKALRLLLERSRLRIEFYSLYNGNTSESDIESIKLIQAQLDPGQQGLVLFYDGSVEQYLQKIANCDYFLGAKFHAVLAAHLCGAKCGVIAYNRKMNDLATELDLKIVVPTSKLISSERWLEIMQKLVSEEAVSGLIDLQLLRKRSERGVIEALETAAKTMPRHISV